MGSAHSSHSSVSTADEDGDDDDPSTAAASIAATARLPAPAPQLPPVRAPPASASKVLEQEPEVLPCHAADSPLSPQPSAAGTPRLLGGPGIKVWDPCHVLLPLPPSSPSPHPQQQQPPAVEVVVVSHGECAAAMRPDLVGGRWPAAALTARGERQARALAVFLRSRGARLTAAYASPLDRARATAALVCREYSILSCRTTSHPSDFGMELRFVRPLRRPPWFLEPAPLQLLRSRRQRRLLPGKRIHYFTPSPVAIP